MAIVKNRGNSICILQQFITRGHYSFILQQIFWNYYNMSSS
uniref:Uncharacterized protein n=1 Tax=Arundo donax TaxID=35708 RepID=A0A0A9C9P3_ARUDO